MYFTHTGVTNVVPAGLLEKKLLELRLKFNIICVFTKMSVNNNNNI